MRAFDVELLLCISCVSGEFESGGDLRMALVIFGIVRKNIAHLMGVFLESGDSGMHLLPQLVGWRCHVCKMEKLLMLEVVDWDVVVVAKCFRSHRRVCIIRGISNESERHYKV